MSHRLVCVAALIASTAFAAEPIALSLEDFKMYRQYLNAMEDPRVMKMKPALQLPAIAKDSGFKVKALEQAVARGNAAGDLKAKCSANLTEALSGELPGRLGKVDVDLSQPHAVAYLQWTRLDPSQVEEEASLVAARTVVACPVVSTIQLWAQEGAQPQTRVFEALISRTSALKISADKVKDFADTRYIRLFEKVKNAAVGDALSSSAP